MSRMDLQKTGTEVHLLWEGWSCTCFKEKKKEGGRQRDIVCYTHDKSRHTARRCPNNVAVWRERWCPLPGDSVLYPLAEEVEVHCI